MLRRFALRTAAAVAFMVGTACLPALAQAPVNQTPTTTPISLNEAALPYKIGLTRVDTGGALPTLQSFAFGRYNGLWVIIGGRTNGLHNFGNEPIRNFPPSKQNRVIWVIDPATWQTWSRPLKDSTLSVRQFDELSSTAMQSVQIGDVLYVVGGYGYSNEAADFTTFRALTAFDLPTIVDWVKRTPTGPGAQDLRRIIRQTLNPVLQVTGGGMTVMHGRAALVFGQSFNGGYTGGGSGYRQNYTGQVRTFAIVDNGQTIRIEDIRNYPETPNLNDFRRRDYNLVPMIDLSGGIQRNGAIALSGVFTKGNGIWTVPVEINRNGVPFMADPEARGTFKQGMNSYSSANLVLFDSRSGANHALLFGGISYEYYKPFKGFVDDGNVPFINGSSVVIRLRDGSYRQVLLQSASFPRVEDASGAALRFGAEAGVFLAPDTPTTGNGLVDLRAALDPAGGKRVIGWIFGGIAAEKPNFGASTASNEVFAITLEPN